MLRRIFLISAMIGLSSCVSRSNQTNSVSTNTTMAPTTTTTLAVAASVTTTTIAPPQAFPQLAQHCEDSLKKFAGKTDAKALKEACATVEMLPECVSVHGTPIYHYNKNGDAKDPANILVFSLIHGDETPAGSVGRFWLERLQTIVPRNNWRVIPILNPDGVKAKTRTNANKVDVNRNFPTLDWQEKAQGYWKKEGQSSPRRFPGFKAGSEPETVCAVKHIDDFKPDFVVSIHTPLKVLDYDGPKVNPPKFDDLPWKSLGHYPGSMGRYMWFERKVPVLTMELKEDLPNSNDPWVKLQDIIGTLVGLEQMNKPAKK